MDEEVLQEGGSEGHESVFGLVEAGDVGLVFG